jgi:hypothetical protein
VARLVVAAQTPGHRLRRVLLMGKRENEVRRVASQHGGHSKPAVTYSLERRRRQHPAQRSRRRLGLVALLWAGRQRSALVDLRGKEGEHGGRHGEKTRRGELLPMRVDTTKQGRAAASTGFIPVSGRDRCDPWC